MICTLVNPCLKLNWSRVLSVYTILTINVTGQTQILIPESKCEGIKGSSRSFTGIYDNFSTPLTFNDRSEISFGWLNESLETPPNDRALGKQNTHWMPRPDKYLWTSSWVTTYSVILAATLNIFPLSLEGNPLSTCHKPLQILEKHGSGN